VKIMFAALLAFLALAVPATAAPLEAYGKLPSIEATAISPSGNQIALVVTDGERRVIVVQELATKKMRLRGGVGAMRVLALRWVGEENLLVITQVMGSPMDVFTYKRDWMTAFGLEVATGKIEPLMRGAPDMNVVLDIPVVRTVEGVPMAFAEGISFGAEGRGRRSLYRVDVRSGTTKLVETGSFDTRDWIVGPDGEIAAQELYDGRSGRWTLRIRSGGAWRDAESVVALQDRPTLLGLGRDGKSVVYANRTGGDWTLREVRLDGGPATDLKPLLDSPLPLHDPNDGHLIGQQALTGDEHRLAFFDPQDTRMWSAVVKAFPGAIVTPRSWSADRRKIVVKVDSPDEGPAFALVDLATGKATWLGEEYLGVGRADISPKKAIRFKARDGLELTGYVTLPRGREAKGLPLVVVPHDGPDARDRPGFDWFSQAAASRGYAVLQVNYRGSAGLGAQLLQAGYGEWGRKMQSDLADGVQHLAADGVVDAKRVCIAGDGYGGYAALAGVTIEQGIYRCAVSVAGISDLSKQVAYARKRGGLEYQRYWERFMGVQDGQDVDLAARSPAYLAARASAPVLLIHGKDDVLVPLEQSQIMQRALKAAGKPVDLIVQKGGDHALSLGETRLEVLTASMAFIEKHNPPGP
jgi:dipeptidyl aminopeptidase/acylaminoacyl peptidase